MGYFEKDTLKAWLEALHKNHLHASNILTKLNDVVKSGNIKAYSNLYQCWKVALLLQRR